MTQAVALGSVGSFIRRTAWSAIWWFFLSSEGAAQTTWVGNVGDWFLPFNWSNGVPQAASPTSFDATINNGGIAQIFTGGASVRRITLGALTGQSGGLLLDAGSLNVAENLRLGES